MTDEPGGAKALRLRAHGDQMAAAAASRTDEAAAALDDRRADLIGLQRAIAAHLREGRPLADDDWALAAGAIRLAYCVLYQRRLAQILARLAPADPEPE